MGLKKGILLDIIMLIILGIGGVIYLTLQETKTMETAKPSVTVTPTPNVTSISPTNTTLVNPASINCTQVGGTLVIQKRGDGGEYGLCQFEDNMACEEWALYRKECPIGGRKTTGYDNIDQKYCAWLGGQTFAQPNAICKLPSGKNCSDGALYNGTCQ